MTAVPIFVGSYPVAGGRAFLPMAAGELMRTQRLIERVLQSFALAPGRFVLLISLLDDGPYCVPFERAVMNRGLLVTNADDSPYEATRIESTCRRFDVAAVAGVTEQVLDGLQAAGHRLDAVFSGRVIWALPGAYERLEAVPGIVLRRMLQVGPALAMECSQGAGAHLDTHEWACAVQDDELVISSLLPRAEDFVSCRTGLRATLIEAPCDCGSVDPRLTPAG